jgi:hypothetical protein
MQGTKIENEAKVMDTQEDQTIPKTQEQHDKDNVPTNHEIDMAGVKFRKSSVQNALEGMF